MKTIGIFLIAAALVLAGCGAPAAPVKNDSAVKDTTPVKNDTMSPPPTVPAEPPKNVSGNATAPPPPPSGTVATQQECATLAPSCGSCIAKAGCGWCKTSNGCYAGDADGPAVVDCQPADWAVTEQACQAPSSPGGTTCAEQFGCGACLTGEGCKFCRQGTVCADISSTDDCFGGWITDFYVCAAGSQ